MCTCAPAEKWAGGPALSLLAVYVYGDEEAKQRFARPNKQIIVRSSSLALHVFSFQRDRGYDESSV